MALIAQVAANGGGRAAGTGAHHDVIRNRVRLASHLPENTVGDIVIAAPVGRALGVGKLIHITAPQLAGEHLGGLVNFTGALHEMTAAAVKFNLFHFAPRGTGGHDGDKRQAQHAGKPGFGNRGRTGRRLDNRRAFADPAVAQAV